MKMQEVRDRAKAAGLTKVGKLSKEELIHQIQSTEGNQPCFGADWRHSCTQMDCCWRSACLD